MEPSKSPTSFVELIKGLEHQDETAASLIYKKYISSLIRLATQKLDPRLGARVDPESVAISVFETFFDNHQKKEILFNNWEALFAYLAKVTIRKSLNRNRLHWQLKRGGKLEHDATMRFNQISLDDVHTVSTSPDPAEVAEVNDMIESAMSKLKIQHRAIMEVFLGNHSKEKTAELTGFSIRTVERVINSFRESILALEDADNP